LHLGHNKKRFGGLRHPFPELPDTDYRGHFW
jgi:hypothetical protein